MKTDAIKAADAALAILDLASQNFPGDTDVEISTSGAAPANGRLVLNSYSLRRVIEAGRAALEEAK